MSTSYTQSHQPSECTSDESQPEFLEERDDGDELLRGIEILKSTLNITETITTAELLDRAINDIQDLELRLANAEREIAELYNSSEQLRNCYKLQYTPMFYPNLPTSSSNAADPQSANPSARL